MFSKSSISRSPSYYQLYDNDSEAVSKSSFGEYDSFLGRIDTFTIPPPHTVASPEYCLVSGHDVQLLENEITTNDSDAIVPLTGDFPDSKEDQPIVFLYARKTLIVRQRRRRVLPFRNALQSIQAGVSENCYKVIP